MNSIYPVANPEKLSDKKGRVLPGSLFYLKMGLLWRFAREIHSDLTKGLLYVK